MREKSTTQRTASSLAHKLVHTPQSHQELFYDKVYTWEHWKNHRNAAYRHRPQPTVFLKVAVGLVYQLSLVLVSSVVVVIYHVYAVPKGAPGATPTLAAAFNMTTFALSLLLVFKTNSSYARWWEGRNCWGQVVNFARNLPRQFISWLPKTEEAEELGRAMLRWTSAAPNVLRGHIIETSAGRCSTNATHVLLDYEITWLQQWADGPTGVALMLSQIGARALQKGYITHIQLVTLEEQISLYTNMSGACERILRTPLPSAYTRHTSRFLMIYVTLSPILLWPSVTWATPAVALIISFLLLGTENIGAQIEEPFWVLPLTAICQNIDRFTKELEMVHYGDGGRIPTAFSEDARGSPGDNLSPLKHSATAKAGAGANVVIIEKEVDR